MCTLVIVVLVSKFSGSEFFFFMFVFYPASFFPAPCYDLCIFQTTSIFLVITSVWWGALSQSVTSASRAETCVRGERPEDWIPPEDVCDDINETLPISADWNDGIVDVFYEHSYHNEEFSWISFVV